MGANKVLLITSSVVIALVILDVVTASTVTVPIHTDRSSSSWPSRRRRSKNDAVFSIRLKSSSSSRSSVTFPSILDHDDDELSIVSDASSKTATKEQSDTTITTTDKVETKLTSSALEVGKATSGKDGGKSSSDNVVVQIVVSMKDEMVRYATGMKELYTNHQRCNAIRQKQKDYREKLRKQWEFEESTLTQTDLKARLAKVNGGITYDEFLFLVKGKDDRSKLFNLFFVAWGAPRMVPYMLIFYQGFLPSPLQKPDPPGARESKLEKLSRIRSHAVLKTLMKLEDEAKEIPGLLSKIIPFGKKSQEQKMDEMYSLAKTMGQVMITSALTPTSSSSSTPTAAGDRDVYGARLTMNTMDPILYSNETFSRADQRLVNVPKSITKGLMDVTSDSPSPIAFVMPHFLKRGQVLTHVQKLSDIDKFLVNENVDLKTLSTAHLLEACSDRCIGGPGRKEEELRQQLSDWLDFTVRDPAIRCQTSGEYYNENLGRAALLGYYAMCGARDSRSSSFLPRMMYDGADNNSSHDGKNGNSSSGDGRNTLKITW